MPYGLEAALKAEAQTQGKPWQTLLKELLADALGIGEADAASETQKRSASELHRAMRKLKSK